MARGFLNHVWSPFNRGLQAVGEVGQQGTRLVGNVFGRTVNGVRSVGKTVTRRMNQGISELVKNRKGGARKSTCKKNTRKKTRKNKH